MSRRSFLASLRQLVFDETSTAAPDLASLGRNLGRFLKHRRVDVEELVAPIRRNNKGFERWLVGEQQQPPVSILLMAWPPGYTTPVHDHGGLWGLEVVISGALDVESFHETEGQFRSVSCEHLALGDSTWFDERDHHAHRCKNESVDETAFTLHVYGGMLVTYKVFENVGHALWSTSPRRAQIAGFLEEDVILKTTKS